MDAKGNCPVMARFIVGKYSEKAFSAKLRVPQSLWLYGRACGKSAAARDINNKLDEIRAAAFSIWSTSESQLPSRLTPCEAMTLRVVATPCSSGPSGSPLRGRN